MAKPTYKLPLKGRVATVRDHEEEINRYGGAIYDAAVVAQLGTPEAAALVAEFEGLRDDTVDAADRAEAAAERLSNGDALILWTGQSNAVQPFDNSTSPDPIDDRVQILNSDRTAFVPLAPGVGGISADATNHSLFNLTRLMLTVGEYESVRVIMVAEGSRPISDWVGTNADRTVSSANTPKMWDIRNALIAARTIMGQPSLQFTHVFMVQGEADAARQYMPAYGNTYAADRLAFRNILKAQGLADSNTRWVDGELLRRDVAATSWHANQVITNLPTIGTDPSAVISSSGFVGQDEGYSITVNGVAVPYTLHFSAAENSLYGIRAFEAVLKLDGGETVAANTDWLNEVAPDGRRGFRPPNLQLSGGVFQLTSQWARDGVVCVNSGTNNVQIQADDLRTGFAPSAGNRITFLIKPGAVLNLVATPAKFVDQVGAIVDSITRTGGYGDPLLTLYWDGFHWRIVKEANAFGSAGAGGPFWEVRNSRLYMRGVTQVGLNAGSTATVEFPAGAPAVQDGQGIIVASGGCVAGALTTTGFTITRSVTVTGSNVVSWSLSDVRLA